MKRASAGEASPETRTADAALLERVPPRNDEAEQAVLGGMLLERDAIEAVLPLLNPNDFYAEAHRQIFLSIRELFTEGQTVDVVTVTDRLRARDALEMIGGQPYLAQLLNAVPTAASVALYADLVRRQAVLREVITTANYAIDSSYQPGADPLAIAGGLVRVAEALRDDVVSETAVISAQELRARAQPIEWVVEGLIPASSLVLLAGDGGLGKTWVGCHLAACVAAGTAAFGQFPCRQGRSLYWDEENGTIIMAQRLAALFDSDCPADMKFVSGQGWKVTDPQVLPRLRRVVADWDIQFVVVDSLRAIHDLRENSPDDMGPLMKSLRQFTRLTAVGMLVLHHTNRPGILLQSASDRVRGTTAIRDEADVYYYGKRLTRQQFSVELDKSRYGPLQPPFVLEYAAPQEGMVALRYKGTTEEVVEPTERAQEAIIEVLIAAEKFIERQALLTEVTARGISERSFKRALVDLLKDGRVRQGPFRNRKRLYGVGRGQEALEPDWLGPEQE